MLTRREIYEIDLTDLSFELFWKEELDGYNPDEYVSQLEFYTWKAMATKITEFDISHKKDLKIE
jgi:hypothetical protein